MDVKIEGLTVTFHGREIVTDTKLELNMGRRYGLIGLNGSGEFIACFFMEICFAVNINAIPNRMELVKMKTSFLTAC